MYKTIEIKDIIGSFCDIMSCQLRVDMNDVREVMKIVKLEQDGLICPNCGKPLEKDWIYCKHCGFKLK